jgi:hypothetical protein
VLDRDKPAVEPVSMLFSWELSLKLVYACLAEPHPHVEGRSMAALFTFHQTDNEHVLTAQLMFRLALGDLGDASYAPAYSIRSQR